MSDTIKPPSTLSEISHLFLSTLREKNPGPKRTPPASRPAASVDLTPEEFDKVGEMDAPADSAPVTAVLCSHLENARVATAAYAQHLVAHNQRVGLIEIDAEELRLSCLAPSSTEELSPDSAAYFEPRHLAEAMEELNADVDRWLLIVKNSKLPEAQNLLRRVSHWLLISTSDSDGIVSAYRSLKALSPLARPRLTVAVLNSTQNDQSDRVYHKITSVCEQFLHWPIERGPTLRVSVEPNIHTIMHWNPQHGSTPSAPHWQVIEIFLARARRDEADISPEEHQEISAAAFVPAPKSAAAQQKRTNAPAAEVFAAPSPIEPVRTAVLNPQQNSTAILSLTTNNPSAVLDAVLQHHQDLISCPVPLPMCETARLTVGRDRQLLLLAVAGKGLSDLRAIGYAYRWLTENRQLVAMAVPQLAIDAAAMPKLRLFIDHADHDAQTLGPILQNQFVEIRPFRTLNWSGRLGLMLEAA
jgi:hypothetical protein